MAELGEYVRDQCGAHLCRRTCLVRPYGLGRCPHKAFGESSNLSFTTMTNEDVNRILMRDWPDHEFLQADGFAEAFAGVVYGKGRVPLVCYDRDICIDILIGEDKDGNVQMTKEEAEEYFSFNVEDAWVGELTPVFLKPMVSWIGFS